MKKVFKSILSWTIIFVMVLGLLPGSIAVAASYEPSTGDIVIIYTNDIHCGVDQKKDDKGNITNIGYAGVAAYKKEMEELAGEDRVTLIDAGDAVQGEAIGSLSKGEYLVDIMRQIGYDIFVPGNHEFDYGMARMQELMEMMEAEKDGQKGINVISGNFTDLKANKLVYEPYTIVTYGEGKDQVEIAYVGITTPESFTKSTPAYFQDDNGNYIYGFKEGNSGKDLYNAVQDAVDDAEAEGADYVIAVGHLGIDEQSAPWRSTDVIANTDGIDAFIDGHSHSVVAGDTVKNKDGEDVLLTQTGTKLANIGRIVIKDDGTIESQLISGYGKQDETTLNFIKNIESEFEKDLAEVVGKTDVALTINDPATDKRIVRSRETNLGDLCADAYRYVLGNGKTGEEAGPADIAFVNGGGVRDNIDAGDIIFGEVIAVHPFNNVGCVVEATGQEILDALEMASRVAPDENGGFLQVSGLEYTIDTSIPTSVEVNDKKEFVKVAGDRRVKDVKVGGQPIDANKTYTLASHNYMLLDGGDGINMFRDNNLIVQPVILDNQILIGYIQDYLKGVVGEDYSDPYGQGRINSGAGVKFKSNISVKEGIKGYIGGYEDGTFRPDNKIKREEVAQLLFNILNVPGGSASFTDVDSGWYASAISALSSSGIFSGRPDGSFGVGNYITRQDFAIALANTFDPTVTGGSETSFNDLEGAYGKDAVQTLVGLGVIKGYEDGTFRPTAPITRAEAVVILNRLFSGLVEKSQGNFNDISGHWAETEIRSAAK